MNLSVPIVDWGLGRGKVNIARENLNTVNITSKQAEQFFEEFISEYKLYNMTPRIIRFLNDLTNWYVRLNRQRIKG